MANLASWKRTMEQEIILRCKMIRGSFLHDVAAEVEKLLGFERAGRQVPISGATNVIRLRLAVTANIYDRVAVTGLSRDLALLCSDSSSASWWRKLSTIGAVPMPSGLVEGGERGGLADMLEYLQTVEYCGLAIEWSDTAQRPYVTVAEPDDLMPSQIIYAPDDPLSPVKISWRRSRTVDGRKMTVIDEWDISDPEAPTFRVLLGGEDATDSVTALAELYASGRLSGPGYLWRYSDGRPFIPVVIYGKPSRVMRQIALTEATLDAVAYRTAVKSAVIDSGFPTREVIGLITGAGSNAQTGQLGQAQGPGDVRVWRHADENKPGTSFQFSATADPEALFRTARAQEQDAVTRLGFPIDLTGLGGEPLATAIAAQKTEIRRWYNICRAGDAILLRRIAAVVNRITGSAYQESGYGCLYGEEVDEELASVQRPAIESTDENTDDGEE